MAGSLKTFWDVVMGRLPERPPGGWTVAEIQARGSKPGFAPFAGCQPDELLDLVLKRSWWRTWVWPDFSVMYGRAGARFGATGVGAAVGGPLGAGIGAVVGGWQSDREALAKARAAMPDGRLLRPELMTPADAFFIRVVLLNIVGIDLFLAALILAVVLRAIDPGMFDSIIAFFAGSLSAPRSIRQISLDLLYFVVIFYSIVFVFLSVNHLFVFFKQLMYSPHMPSLIKTGGSGFYMLITIPIVTVCIYFVCRVLARNWPILDLSDYMMILLLPLIFLGGVLAAPVVPRVCYLMFYIRRSGKLPNWLRFEA